LKAWGDVNIEVAGHTDSKGSDAYNMKLSQQRAEAVRNFLISRGVAADRLTAKGYGESQPVADNATEEGRFQNRRVELYPLK
jgi:outer membrane protein OmpA-like peptidoglycan-associated protein